MPVPDWAATEPVKPPPSPSWEDVQQALLATELPITARYRALFCVKTLAPSPGEAVDLLIRAFDVQTVSMLLRHEIAYVLGQLGEASAAAGLHAILKNGEEDEVVRHEAAEAIAALDDIHAIDVLDAIRSSTSAQALRDTCELAVVGLRRKQESGDREALPVCVCQYTSKDPAEGRIDATAADVPIAARALADDSLPLYERYEAMFTLRNVGGSEACSSLAKLLRSDQSSAVLRHEIAFVLAQMEDETATVALSESLADRAEHCMVRHEAAIALGTIGTPEAEKALRLYVADDDVMVAESCMVALATAAYWRAWESLEAQADADNGSP